MARRLFNGNAFSENGWPYVDEGSCTWATIPGTAVHIQIQNGVPLAILRAWEADWNANIEPLRDADTACFTQGNSVSTSNHPGATAVDSDWDSHPMGPHAPEDGRAGFSVAQVAEMRKMIAFYTYKGIQMVWWANDWNSPHDSMHSQMGYGTYETQNDRVSPIATEFVARFIRADGYSTYKRDNVIVPPTDGDAVDVLMRATGITHDKAVTIMPTVIQGLRLSQCTTPLRIAMWLAQIGEESGSFVYTEEIAKNGRYAPYIGRTWIQITWDYNYLAFSQWLYGQGLISTPTYFVDHPTELAAQQWAGIGPAWYWTVERPRINAMCDAGDLVGVTQAINGGQNGAADRKNRYDRAMALGDELLALTATSGDEMSAQAERMIQELYDEYKANRHSPSRSFFAKDQQWGESPLGFEWNVDGNVNELYMTMGYLLDVDSIVADVEYVAANGVAPASWAGSLLDGAGKPWLAEVGQQWCAGLVGFRTALRRSLLSSSAATVVQDQPVAQPLPQIVYRDSPVAVASSGSSTQGQLIGNAYDAAKALLASPDMDETEKSAAAALISVLQTKTGATA